MFDTGNMEDSMAIVTPWMKHNAPRIDPAWAFAEAQRKRENNIPDPPPHVQDRKNRFKSAMRELFQTTSDSQAKDIFEHTHTWEEVRAEAQKALDLRYKSNGKKNFLRRSIRSMGETASRLEFLTALVPSGDYMGVLCGGLKLVYNAANRMNAVRDIILGSLETLSRPIEDASPYLYTYSWSETLLEKANNLYICILDAIEAIMKWISKKRGVFRGMLEKGKAVVQQDDYGAQLEATIGASVDEKAKAFETAVKSCLSIEVHDMGQNVVWIGQGQDAIRGDLKHLVQAAASWERCEAILRDYMRQIQPILAYHAAMASQATQACITIEQLLTALHSPEPFPSTDIIHRTVGIITTERRRLLISASLLGVDAEDQVTGVLQDSRFRNWLQRMYSQVLVVSNMEQDILQESPISPLTSMCSVLLKSLTPSEPVIPIAFFCRQHCSTQDGLAGVREMLRSLINQLTLTLAESNRLDLSFLLEDGLDAVRKQDVMFLCRLFAEVVKRIPSGVIICIIDGIDFFSNQIHLPWLNVIMRFFNDLMGFVTGSLVFKMLLTSHRGASLASQWFPCRVELPMHRNEMLNGIGVIMREMQSIF
ncbi:hypothetical protein BO83DRAFT_410341 [Aspergillus eucalypticola CBS 122712]|uniref:Nephrocystin 3-like N-terminal domain-containing protein n=1 Tax=Aspergillus eucalypticola (strain CBS 122712 / IBT 29274) TaxID=1448314 RepID=A0A317UYZ0_ASPEC|nr:uncharacterized protein BO83DRAFT_410341 [Aspergillus eucalypticola CBS 122712]PWY66995.1 hypothetical protein BO83DRAFT_410341 [Aspergillus eucalypticola CBS 122712]